MTTTHEADLLVVGGGKAGKSLAMDRARAGGDVVLVERDKIGGTCINVACIPTKALVASARALLAARHAADLGIDVGGEPRVVLDRLRAHKEGVVGAMVDAHRTMFADSGMTFLEGTATFVGERTVRVDLVGGGTREVRGRDVVINTGSTPAWPDLPGPADVAPWTSESILRLDRLPDSVVILGGGYIGCEFASLLAAFGTRVTVVQRADRLLPREDRDVSGRVGRNLSDQGVDLRLGAQATGVRREGDRVLVDLADGGTVTASDLLLATGRRPVTPPGLAAAGVDLTPAGHVLVDDRLRTTADHVWAAGDVTGGPQFTHSSWHDFRVLRALLTGGEATTAGRLVPYTVFVTPELARVGMTEADARAAGREVRVATLDVAAIPRAKTRRELTGWWKAVVDAGTQEILGVALIGPDAGEVVAAVQMAMLGGLTWPRVRDAVITHPTMAEGLNLLFDSLG